MTVLPTDGSLSHNWLYSFLPVTKDNLPTLVGFCKQCRHTFIYYIPVVTKQIPVTRIRARGAYTETTPNKAWSSYQEYDAKIPKFGCVNE